MDSLKSKQIEVIRGFIANIYRVNDVRVSPYSVDVQAEALYDLLEEAEIEQRERYHEKEMETHSSCTCGRMDVSDNSVEPTCDKHPF